MNRQEIIDRFLNNHLATSIGLNASNSLIVKACLDEWERPHRFYHGMNHLSYLLEEIDNLIPIVWPVHKKEEMDILALWHDVAYDPRKITNEEDSIKFINSFKTLLTKGMSQTDELLEAIKYTKYNDTEVFADLDLDNIIRTFCLLDIGPDYTKWDEKRNVSGLVARELLMLKEFQFSDFPTYRKKRIDFIKNFKYFSVEDKDASINFLSNYRPKIGVYAGSFNPFHSGHMNVLEQAEKIFDKVIIAVGRNPAKSNVQVGWSARNVLPFHEIVEYKTLLPDYLKSMDYADVTLIRGLRNGYDLQYEMNQLRLLEDYGCKTPVAYFICGKEFAHISSSDIRGLREFDLDSISKYMPKKYSYSS